jgi:hypothetical protein
VIYIHREWGTKNTAVLISSVFYGGEKCWLSSINCGMEETLEKKSVSIEKCGHFYPFL